MYHLTARGNGGSAIFVDDFDRLYLLDLLVRVVRGLHWSCFAYCLMGNHYHLLVQTAEPNLSNGMHLLQTSYVRRFNRRHDRQGHLFGRRFHDQPISRDEHLVAAAVYTVLNPVRAGIVERPEEWRWSSYGATAGLEEEPAFLDVEPLLSMLSPSTSRARELFREMVEAERTAGARHPAGARHL